MVYGCSKGKMMQGEISELVTSFSSTNTSMADNGVIDYLIGLEGKALWSLLK